MRFGNACSCSALFRDAWKRFSSRVRKGTFPHWRAGFSQAIAKGTLRESMESMPVNNALQLDLVLGLAKQRLGDGDLSPRLAECLNDFLAGIGHETLSFEKQCEAYAAAYKDFYEPFFLKFPGTLENLLLNMVFRSVFPFGIGIFAKQKAIEPARQYALLVTEFALIKGLLIGVAGSPQASVLSRRCGANGPVGNEAL